MPEAGPVIYLLHGEDEFSIAQAIADLESRLGDPGLAAMNTSRLDGRTFDPEQLLSVAGAMPFLAKRRLVILKQPTNRLNGKAARDKFLAQLDRIPPTTALVLVEEETLKGDRKEPNWLLQWAEGQGARVFVKCYPLPKGGEMIARIQKITRQAGGQIEPQAAQLLADLIGDDPRLADQEIHKLLAYVNYQRPIEADDVEMLTADADTGDIFAFVDAVGNQEKRKALNLLHRLLEVNDPIQILSMIVRQVRMILITKELLASGQGVQAASILKVKPFVVDKLFNQGRSFDEGSLVALLHRLVEVDEAIKTGEMEGETALDILVFKLTS